MDQLVVNLVQAALMECCAPSFVSRVTGSDLHARIVETVKDDLSAFADKDPAARGDGRLIGQSYSSFKAVLHYRLANALWTHASGLFSEREREDSAMLISARGKLLSGAELHYRCRVGARFILDHGFGTVIGETAVIGDDCYLLGGVTLGATGIAANASGKRHPTIGDRVQIGAFARIYGPVTIGSDVFIGPHCMVVQSIPDHSIVTLKSENQVTRNASARPVAQRPSSCLS